MKRVAIYTRVSTCDGQQTIDNQLNDLNLVAERLGWHVVAYYADVGIWSVIAPVLSLPNLRQSFKGRRSYKKTADELA